MSYVAGLVCARAKRDKKGLSRHACQERPSQWVVRTARAMATGAATHWYSRGCRAAAPLNAFLVTSFGTARRTPEPHYADP